MRTSGVSSLTLARSLGILCIVTLGLGAIVGSGCDDCVRSGSVTSTIPSEGGVLSLDGKPLATFPPNTFKGPADVTLAIEPKTDADAVSAIDITLSMPANKMTLAARGEITLNFYESDIRSAQDANREIALAQPAAIDTTKLFAQVVVGGKTAVSYSTRVVSGGINGVYTVGLTTLQLTAAAAQLAQELGNEANLLVRVYLRIDVDGSNTSRLLYRWTSDGGLSAVGGAVAPTGNKVPLILVHGIAANPRAACGATDMYSSTWRGFALNFFTLQEAASLREEFDLYTFQYPTNQSIKSNGLALARKIFEHFGNRPVVIVGHSMGGLVTRAADVLYGKGGINGDSAVVDIDIRRVVTLDTPHRGVPWADDGAVIIEKAFCWGPASHQGAADLRWDGMDSGKCDNPLLCAATGLNTHVAHLKKYIPYAGRFDVAGLPSPEVLRALTVADLVLAQGGPSAAGAVSAASGALIYQWCKDSPHPWYYCAGRVIQIASQAALAPSARSDGDGATLIKSQRLQWWTGSTWKDQDGQDGKDRLFAAYRPTFDNTDHSSMRRWDLQVSPYSGSGEVLLGHCGQGHWPGLYGANRRPAVHMYVDGRKPARE